MTTITIRHGKSLVAAYAVLMVRDAQPDELVKRLEANELIFVDECYKPESSYKQKKSKGEKKRQRSEWNQNMRGFRK